MADKKENSGLTEKFAKKLYVFIQSDTESSNMKFDT